MCVLKSPSAVACRTLERFRVWGLGFRIVWNGLHAQLPPEHGAYASKDRWEVAFDPGEHATHP